MFVTATGYGNPSIKRIVSFWLFAIVLITLSRAFARVLVHRSDAFVQDTIIVGAGEVGLLLAHKIRQHPEYGINVVGFADSSPTAGADGLGELRILGHPAEVPTLVTTLGIERVIVAFSNDPYGEIRDLIRRLDELDVRVDLVPRLYEVLGPDIGVHTIEGVPLMGSRRPTRALLSPGEARLRHVLRAFGARPALAGAPRRCARGQARLAGAGVLPQTRMGGREQIFDIFKVPDDVRGCRRA